MADQNTPVIQQKGSNIGINTVSPSERFHVAGNAYISGVGNALYFDTDGSGKSITQYVTSLYQFHILNSRGNSSRFILGNGSISLGTSTTEMFYINTSTGNVGIGTPSPDGKLHVYSSATAGGIRVGGGNGAGNSRIFIEAAGNSSYIDSYGDSTYKPLAIDATPLKLNVSAGNVGVGNSNPSYKFDVSGRARISTGLLISDDSFEIVLGPVSFNNAESNKAFDVRFGNTAMWGYIEIEVCSTYNNQNSPGKLTKLFAIGTNPSNAIYTNESRVVDTLGAVPNNVAIGEFAWDGTNSTYYVPISHIVNTGNAYNVKVRMYTQGGSARSAFDAISLSSVYTLTALSRNYTYYNDRVGIGTSSPTTLLDVRGKVNVVQGGRTLSLGDGNYANHILCDSNVDFAFNYNNSSTGGFGFFGGTSSAKFMCSYTGTLTVSGDMIAYGSPSDARLKTIKEKIPNALDTVLKLNGYRFDWKEKENDIYGEDKTILHIKEDIGVIAQEVINVLPELARTNEDGYMSVRYQGLTAVLIEAIKEQQTQIEEQKQEIRNLKALVGSFLSKSLK